MKNPCVIDPPDFDIDAAWGECREWVDNHEPGSFAAAAGADPGCVSCPACREFYWAWGSVQRCDCGFEFPVDWWPMYSQGCQDGKRVRDGAQATGGMERRAKDHPYYDHGYRCPSDDPISAKDTLDWPEVINGRVVAFTRRYSYCERCGKDKEGRRARSSQICVSCESLTTCQHLDRSGPWERSSVCKAGVRLGELIEDIPGWALRIPCRFMAGGCPVSCHAFSPMPQSQLEMQDAESDQAIAKTLAAMSVVAEVKKQHKGTNWRGTRECPVCRGVLHLSHAASNGHVWGKCETEGCVAWME